MARAYTLTEMNDAEEMTEELKSRQTMLQLKVQKTSWNKKRQKYVAHG